MMDVFEAIRNRRSVRSYASTPIPADVMQRMRDALRLAPSACNFQPWRFIIVADEQMRRDLANASNGQKWVAEAPVVVVGVGLAGEAYKKMGGRGNSVDIDLSIALDHLSLAAVAEGLGTCWIGAFDESAVKALLDVPKDAKVTAMMTLGYPSKPDLNKPAAPARRKLEAEVFYQERYQVRK